MSPAAGSGGAPPDPAEPGSSAPAGLDAAQALLDELLRRPPELPYDPGLLRELFDTTRDDSLAPLSAVAGVVNKAQGLATRVLSLANSAYYGLQSEVTSVQRAVAVLGMAEIRALVLALGVSRMIDRSRLPAGFDLREYWIHQLSVAAGCRLLARRLPGCDAETCYTAGLLHDLGKLLIAAYRPDDWAAIRQLARDEKLMDSEAEELLLGLDHGVVGARLLSFWDLPMALTEPINWHHAPHLAGEHERAALVVHVADATLRLRERLAGRDTNGMPGSLPDGLPEDLLIPQWLDDAARKLGVDVTAFMAEIETLLEGERIGQFVSQLA
ncbi:HDOD domain-containing protein [Nitratidesulfovibrio sp. HK-II]|uniref:HDOD domain-containing protein n=1 Tax=Nitratidesulfovibrio sp. HK-II TaxID=2009266 RepID=UPI000E2F5CA8|nr:HDOD domain-containing protein [Nitratidesulfovibrio sp. HK-II]GBO95223.1 HD domain protein [Nitratidesulfovibrio sp. HK-II]